MKVREARALAARWVAGHAADIAGFGGAFLSGSVIWLPAERELPASSDVDVQVVTDGDPPAKLGKLPYGGALVEVSFLSWEQLGPAERVLGSYHLAGSSAWVRHCPSPPTSPLAPADLPRRALKLRAFLPRLAEIRDAILATTPAIRDEAPEIR